MSQEIGDEAGQAYILGNLAQVARDRGDRDRAEKLLTQGLALAQAQADKYLVSSFLTHLGIVSLLTGRPNQAIEQANAALTLQREIDLPKLMVDNVATLAAAHFSLRNMSEALDYAQQALALLDESGGEGPEFPHRDYFICYQVLSAAAREQAARTALQSAYELVMRQAGKITDSVIRQSFLERAPMNREIAQAAASLLDTDGSRRNGVNG